MAVSSGLAYRTPGLDRVVALAAACGGAAKPSGAGGGDCAVAMFRAQADERAFRAACAAHDLVVLAASLDPGVRLEG
jgi:phosphomevalonate kinase